MQAEALVHIIRGDTVESVHRGHFIVLDGRRNVIAQAGDPDTVTFFRSACKPMQAIPLLTTGAADKLGFDEREIALACASHSGERIHVRIAAGMLEKAGLTEKHLRCGVHLPFNTDEAERLLIKGDVPSQLHNNCSGKHAGMLAASIELGADLSNYELLESAIQQKILEIISKFAEIPVTEIAIGIDGCAAPNFALPLSGMARSFLNLIMPPDDLDAGVADACGRIVSAMVQFPELIGGTGRLDTMIMQAAPGTLVSKVGADGVWVCGVLPNETWPHGLAIALKIEDGDDHRARPSAVVRLLKHLSVIPDDALPELSPMKITNRRGDVVGRVEPAGACSPRLQINIPDR